MHCEKDSLTPTLSIPSTPSLSLSVRQADSDGRDAAVYEKKSVLVQESHLRPSLPPLSHHLEHGNDDPMVSIAEVYLKMRSYLVERVRF